VNPEAVSSGTDLWASVVYGRTYSADLWWRALPVGVDRTGPEAAVVMAAVGGGRGLNRSPRLALARLRTGTLLGVACQAKQLGTGMDSDGRRPLFCFVGWFAAGRPDAGVPELAEVEAAWTVWARDEYEARMRDVWKAHPSKLRTAELTSPDEPPWSQPGRRGYEAPEVSVEVARAILQPARGQVRVHPSAGRALVWRAVARYGPDTALVTGWASYHDAVLDGVTDVCADDVTAEPPLLVSAPPRRVQPRAGSQPVSPAPSSAAPSPEAGGATPVSAQPGAGSGSESFSQRLMSRFVQPVIDVIREEVGLGPPPPPPEDVLSDWTYYPEYRVYITDVGGFSSCWDGRLWRLEDDRWVDWFSGGEDAGTDEDTGTGEDDDSYEDQDEHDEEESEDEGEPAGGDQRAARPQTMSGEGIDRFNQEFGGG
jgi:hypothetical protein